MNSFQLKLLACLFMVIDHIGYIMFPNIEGFRIVGRLSFPLFAFLLTEGYNHTSNLKKHFSRILIFAISLQIPYAIVYGMNLLNIFFTLFFGMLVILIYDKIQDDFKKQSLLKWSLIGAIIYLSKAVHMDYGYYGIITIFLFWKFKDRWDWLIVSQILLNVFVYKKWPIQFISLLSLFFIKTYNKKIGYNSPYVKYGFYLFYPLHLLLIYLINEYL